MKVKGKLLAVAAMMFAACQSNSKKTECAVTGIYANSSNGDYGVAKDTIIVSQTDDTHYHISERTTYQAIRDGKLLPPHSMVKNYPGEYDPQKQELNETVTGRTFQFNPEKQQLLINQAVYTKIK